MEMNQDNDSMLLANNIENDAAKKEESKAKEDHSVLKDNKNYKSLMKKLRWYEN